MSTTTKARRCTRCGRRNRYQPNWNVDYIAGLEIGVYCPDCQTSEEDLGAQVNEVLSPPSGHTDFDTAGQIAAGKSETEVVAKLVNGLKRVYPNPEVMRAKADQLAAARQDPAAEQMVWLMRQVADGMEEGSLWEDGKPGGCYRCHRQPSDGDDSWAILRIGDGDSADEYLLCPDCVTPEERGLAE